MAFNRSDHTNGALPEGGKGTGVMANIRCDVTNCRYNGHHRCTLGTVEIARGDVIISPAVLGDDIAYVAGSFRAGYATEFLSYVDYARSQPESPSRGALCQSFSIL